MKIGAVQSHAKDQACQKSRDYIEKLDQHRASRFALVISRSV
jgi:hypothetical protein